MPQEQNELTPGYAEPLPGAVYLITGDQIGISDAGPGQMLMRNLLCALSQSANPPSAALLINKAVLLAAEGSESLEHLQALAGRGTVIKACGTCVEYYGLSGKLAAGEVTNMADIVATIGGAARVVTL